MKQRYFFLISLIIFFFDQLIKDYIHIYKPNFRIIHYVNNTGGAFGFFQGWNGLLAFLTFAVLGVIIYLYVSKSYYFKETPIAVSAALIVGGALGNLVDRLTYGYVIDYIDLGFWPVFNLADIALTIGVVILLVSWWREK